MSQLLHQVKENLLFQNLWTQVSEIQLPQGPVLKGIPKEKLMADEEQLDIKDPFEIVFPSKLKSEVTPHQLDTIFKELEQTLGKRPRRIIIGIVNDDSTVVYYFVHDGVYKPKKN